MSAAMILITQSGTVTVPLWWWVMRVEDRTVVLQGSPDCSPPQVLVIEALETEAEASALFDLINQRIASGAKLLDVRQAAALLGTAAAETPKETRGAKRSPIDDA